jgi:cytochrome P450
MYSRAMLRDPRIYVDPERFNPDRFLETNGHVPEMNPSDVGVFGFGRRCVKTEIGRELGLPEFQSVPGTISR